ncbi:MAG: hypothetical protein IT260_05070 [Saprospiraceae bacterium]|nr:hypothetical protein [Saprospiraceae bacterium]
MKQFSLLQYTCLCLVCCLFLQWSLPAQQLEVRGVYVAPFFLENGQTNKYTIDITDKYRSVLSKAFKRTPLINYDDEAILEGFRREHGFPAQFKDSLIRRGANILVIGKVTEHLAQGSYTVNIKFTNIYSKELYANIDESLETALFENKTSRDLFLQSQALVPDESYLPSTFVDADVIRKKDLQANEKIWRILQPSFMEDFTNHNAAAFRGDIWTLSNTKTHRCLVKDQRYLVKNTRDNFFKHKYIEDKRVAFSDFSMAQAYSITIHIPDTTDCTAKTNCLGRGLSVRYDKVKNSGYGLAMNDDGELKFFKFFAQDPNTIETLWSMPVPGVRRGKDYELGIICVGDTYYLFLDRIFRRMINDSTFSKGLNGILGIGKGTHWFDNVTIYKPMRVQP